MPCLLRRIHHGLGPVLKARCHAGLPVASLAGDFNSQFHYYSLVSGTLCKYPNSTLSPMQITPPLIQLSVSLSTCTLAISSHSLEIRKPRAQRFRFPLLPSKQAPKLHPQILPLSHLRIAVRVHASSLSWVRGGKSEI